VHLSHVTRAVLASGSRVRPRWFDMVPPDGRTVAAAVEVVLDDIERHE
jgi:hypothetical protein